MPMSEPLSLQMVASKRLGGAERWFMRFVEALDMAGAPTEVAIRRGSGMDGHDFGSLAVHRLPYLTVWDPLSRHAVARLIRERRPAVVQTYMGRATRLVRLPRDGKGPVHLARLGGYYALHAYRHAHGWIGNTRALCDWMIAQGLPAERVYHLYNFADPPTPVEPEEVAGLRARHGIPDDAWVLVALGRMVPFKNHKDAIAALSRLPEEIAGRPLRLVLVGDGPLRAALEAQARQSGQWGRIVWAGWQRRPEPYLALADLVVFPSLDTEPMGNVILEAWSWDKPLVVTRFRGAREIVRHGDDAFTVPCEDPAALAEGIRQVLSDPALMADLTHAARARVAGEFSRDAITAQYLELYRSLSRDC